MFASFRHAAAAALVVLFAVAATSLGAAAQVPDPAVAEQAQATPPADAPEYPAAAPLSPTGAQPGAAQPPRTLRAYWHLFIAFAVTWLLLFGYAVSVGRRWARLEREVQVMRVE